MFKPIIAGLTALSLTLATATPISAQGLDREDVGKLLIGLAAVAVIGAAIEGNRDRRSGNEAADTGIQAHDNVHRNGINRSNNWADLNRQSQSNNARRTVPFECLQTVETRFGAQRLFGRRCLERNYRHVNQLPDRCAVRLYTTNGPVRGYDPLCLREQGFQSDRRH